MVRSLRKDLFAIWFSAAPVVVLRREKLTGHCEQLLGALDQASFFFYPVRLNNRRAGPGQSSATVPAHVSECPPSWEAEGAAFFGGIP